MTKWEKYKIINEKLKSDFFCIPPYNSVTGKFVNEAYEMIEDIDKLHGLVSALINNPWQRAFQIEYCYKECDIFLPFIQIIDYATYDAMVGNWICSYLSLVPAVEAIMDKWYERMPNTSYKGMRQAAEIIQHIGIFDDDRSTITEEHIKYLEYIFGNLFFERFDKYKKQKHSDVFNRNLTVHKLEGVSDISEGLRNMSRLYLILDIIAELYLMKEPKRYGKYWNRYFNSNYDEVDFQLRWNLYKKLIKDSLYSSDLNILQNCYYGSTSSQDKKENALEAIKLHMDIFDKSLKKKR